MTERVADFESLLRQALAPVDPPAELEARLEQTLGSLVGMAADELESWELSAVKDPKNWIRLARPAAAVVVGSGAAVGLVVLRTHRKRAHARGKRDLAGRAMREARKVFGELSRGH
jgi:hypothetical protein